jgi:hypothetical protein
MFALVRNGAVVRTFNAIPDTFENVSGFQLMSVLERRDLGFFPVTDARPPLTNDRQSYIDETYTPGTTEVVRSATIFERPKTADEIDREAVEAYPKLTTLKTSTPAQVQAWVDANVTDLASAKDAIKTLAVAVGFLARKL